MPLPHVARAAVLAAAATVAAAASMSSAGVSAYTAYSVCDEYAHDDCTEPHPNWMNGTLRVAVAQTASNTTTTLEQNAAKHVDWIARAAAEGARTITFPELSMTGYCAQTVLDLAGPDGLAAVANKRLRAAEDTVAAACKEHNIYAMIGIPVFNGDVNASHPRPWYNTVLVISPDGEKVYRQAKLYPCCEQDGDQGLWLDTFNITNTDGSEITVGLQICFDDFHPEIIRLQSMAGAQIQFYSSWESDVSLEFKLSLGDKLASAQAVVNAHAMLNQMFILQSNAGALVSTMMSEHTPTSQGQATSGSHGQSRVVDPFGITLEEARVFGEQLLIHDLDLTLLFPPQHRMSMGGLTSTVFSSMWKEGMKTLGNRMPIEW